MSIFLKGCYFASFFFFFSGCSCNRQALQSYAGQTMGTTYHIKYTYEQEISQDLKAKTDLLLTRVNNSMSTYQDNSELSLFNHSIAKGDWYPISSDLQVVLQASSEIYKNSAGWFDPTVGPAVNIWGFGPDGAKNVPSEDQIQQAKNKIGFNHLEFNSSEKKMRKLIDGIYLDFSAIAKGFGVDQVAELLESQKIKNYLVEIGGEIRVRGTKADNVPWSIGIEAPDRNEQRVQKIIKLDNIGMATSGDYRNFFAKGDQFYSHTIDPNTAMPVKHQLGSVSVFHPSCMMADGWATALLSMGPQNAIKKANELGLSAYFLYRENGEIKEAYSEQAKKTLK